MKKITAKNLKNWSVLVRNVASFIDRCKKRIGKPKDVVTDAGDKILENRPIVGIQIMRKRFSSVLETVSEGWDSLLEPR